jgi:hypothetical protein
MSDIDQDGMADLVLFYDAGELRRLAAEAGPETGALGLHYVTQDGMQILIPDLFALGEPVSAAAEVAVTGRGAPGPGRDLRTAAGDAANTLPESQAAPAVTRVAGILPNPFRGGTTVALDLAAEREVSVRVYNLQGALVRDLARGVRPAGRQTIAWDGRDSGGRRLPAGVYLVRVVAGEFSAVRKAIVIE